MGGRIRAGLFVLDGDVARGSEVEVREGLGVQLEPDQMAIGMNRHEAGPIAATLPDLEVQAIAVHLEANI